jgi:hypothetical protein
LYKVVAARSEHRSKALLTNVDFEAWGEYLGDPPLAIVRGGVATCRASARMAGSTRTPPPGSRWRPPYVVYADVYGTPRTRAAAVGLADGLGGLDAVQAVEEMLRQRLDDVFGRLAAAVEPLCLELVECSAAQTALAKAGGAALA